MMSPRALPADARDDLLDDIDARYDRRSFSGSGMIKTKRGLMWVRVGVPYRGEIIDQLQ